MANWKNRLDVHDIFSDDDMPFELRRDEVVRRIRKARFFNENDQELVDIVNALEQSDDVEEFDGWWDDFYDWADTDHRLWVDVY